MYYFSYKLARKLAEFVFTNMYVLPTDYYLRNVNRILFSFTSSIYIYIYSDMECKTLICYFCVIYFLFILLFILFACFSLVFNLSFFLSRYNFILIQRINIMPIVWLAFYPAGSNPMIRVFYLCAIIRRGYIVRSV